MNNLNELRRLAGIPIMEKQGHYEPLDPNEVPDNDIKGDHTQAIEPEHDGTPPKSEEGNGVKHFKGGKAKGEGKDGEEEPAFPEIVTAMAAKIEGKTGDELVAIVAKLYDAGVKDGVAQAKAEEEGKENEEGGEHKKKKNKDSEEDHKDDEPKDSDVPPPPVDDDEEEEVTEAFSNLDPSKYYVHYASGNIIAGPLDLQSAKDKVKEYVDGGNKDVTYSLGSALKESVEKKAALIRNLRRMINY
jgi:hypothetical protein